MQSSYNVIKNNTVKNSGSKQIVTSSELIPLNAENEEHIKNHIESYENLARTMLENARRQGEQVVAKAYEDASYIESQALKDAEGLKQEAYDSAFKEGYEQGYNEAYNSGIEKVKVEGEAIIASAMELLNNSKAEYEEYLQKKSAEIKELVLTITKSVLNKELQEENVIKNMIYVALEQSKGSRNFIIRCNEKHVQELKAQVENWKEQLGFFGDIFVLKDETINVGNAIIDKGNGKIIVGVEYALQRINQILEGKD